MKKIALVLPLKIALASTACLVALTSQAQSLRNSSPFSWTCSNGMELKTSGTAENLTLEWNSKNFVMNKETSLPGSLRYKNMDTGLDLVVLGNKAMLFNIKSGVRLADFCQTADMKGGKDPHLFTKVE
ncbi:hypothetical protein LZG75_07260 [Polynucleobacter sp. IMCC30063]|uniref:hypothetical protein n=1 Tax=unclassified Polynucleobacter TaxID=2640945 RepID=UPI001F1F98E8|nr:MULTISPECIES: hypothetical protein [unclassified Polynucleobacter]MCE7506037.1 hypothetical protein [Polynucleobacter sp. IMCC30063]MCE7527201.1 hypothetical protein [Polynucleobacter sp. IMCC 30228]MCE7528942.1 hypothetical protein [Polynucleobacter sp. IMCC 29146]